MSSPSSTSGAWPTVLLALSLVVLGCLLTGRALWMLALAAAAYPVPLVMACGAGARGLGIALGVVLIAPVGVLLILEASAAGDRVWLGLPVPLHWMIAGLWLLPLAAVTWLYLRTFPPSED